MGCRLRAAEGEQLLPPYSVLSSLAFLQQRAIRNWTNFFGIFNYDHPEIELVSNTYRGDPKTGYKIMPSNKLITEPQKKKLFYLLDFLIMKLIKKKALLSCYHTLF